MVNEKKYDRTCVYTEERKKEHREGNITNKKKGDGKGKTNSKTQGMANISASSPTL